MRFLRSLWIAVLKKTSLNNNSIFNSSIKSLQEKSRLKQKIVKLYVQCSNYLGPKLSFSIVADGFNVGRMEMVARREPNSIKRQRQEAQDVLLLHVRGHCLTKFNHQIWAVPVVFVGFDGQFCLVMIVALLRVNLGHFCNIFVVSLF
jgi:hypothetical protein